KGALDHYDTIFLPNKTQKEEILECEEKYNLNKKNLVECGYFILDDMIEAYENKKISSASKDKKTILIAPSWQEDNIVDNCLDELLDILCNSDYHIIIRPHPQHVRHKRDMLEKLKIKHENNPNVEVQLDFSPTDTVWKADILITDWSDISMEYAFCTNKPVLFINTPMKIQNPDYKEIDIVPINIKIRDSLGQSVDLDNLDKVLEIIDNLINKSDYYAETIDEFKKEQVYNIGHSAEVGGRYIIERLLERTRNKS
ncbi:MAG: CDP-glycerol glycerophosphotransferase family protein, partial [Lachnospiraceae bacterium]|nr:CDP-glycerol glycerophosphotransferase family protein [Lachnospiraceae bacterium]